MNKLILCSLIVLLYACFNTSSDQEKEARELKVELVLHDPISTKEASELKDKIRQTSRRLFDDFDLSEDEVFTIHIWKDYGEYLSAQEINIGAQYEGSAGYVFSQNDLAIYYNDDMVESAEHEFAHAASLHINSEFANNPRWLWESVAIYESNEFTHPKELDYLTNGDFPSISELNGMISPDGANKIYKVGYLLAEFIIDKWGRDKYLELIRRSSEWDKVLAVSEREFEEQWKQFVTTTYLD